MPICLETKKIRSFKWNGRKTTKLYRIEGNIFTARYSLKMKVCLYRVNIIWDFFHLLSTHSAPIHIPKKTGHKPSPRQNDGRNKPPKWDCSSESSISGHLPLYTTMAAHQRVLANQWLRALRHLMQWMMGACCSAETSSTATYNCGTDVDKNTGRQRTGWRTR